MDKSYNNAATVVVEAHCGKGKTSWAIQYMNEHPEKKYIFITPFLTEAKRIQAKCPALDFKQPKNEHKSKFSHLKDLLAAEENIVSTHSLFSYLDSETLELLRMGNYTIILDEVMDIVHQEQVSLRDIRMLQETGLLIIDSETGKVSASAEAVDYTGAFKELIEKAQSGRLVCFNDTFLLWQFPPDVFEVLQEVFVLTYLFEGQIQRCYFDYHGLPYELRGVEGSQEDGYELTNYDPIEGDRELREWMKTNVNIYEGKLNESYDKGLSYTWHTKHCRNRRVMSKLKNDTYNYFSNVVGGKSNVNMWTTFKDTKEQLQGKGYTKGFVTHSARATNDFAHKKNLAYLVNRNLQPGLVNYFKSRGVEINGDLFAVSELIQWMFRSAIRKREPINLYIPSKRIRDLLKAWINQEL